MMKGKWKIRSSVLQSIAMSVLFVLSFMSIFLLYYAMLHSEISKKIAKNGELCAMESSHRVDKYLSVGTDIMRVACRTLDKMIRDGRSRAEMLDYLLNQSAAIESIMSGNSNGIYGFIEGEFLDGTGWKPDAGFIPVERPWYIGARGNSGRIAVIDPYLDVRTGRVVITLSKTLCDGKSVIAIDFFMDRLQSITEELAARGESDMEIVLDRMYHVITHSNRSEIGKNYLAEDDTFGSALVKGFRASKKDSFSFEAGGMEYIAYAVPVANDWLCVSVFNATSAFRQLIDMLNFTVIMSLLVISIAVLFINSYNERERLAQQMNEKAEREAAANEAKSSFLSNMSHEIRTPINAVLGMNEMILRESGEQKTLEYAGNIRTAGNALLGLVNDILDFSKIEAGKMEIISADYDLSSLINDLVTMVQARADKKGLQLKLDFDEKLPRRLNGDEVRIRQAITNILTNAVKYTQKGRITFRIGYEKILNDPNAVYLNISVSDTGIGIKPEDIEKLFSQFERIEEKRNRNIEGTGLGLNITRSLLEMMGSSLKVESVYGKGSKFSFCLRQKVVSWEPLGDYEIAYRASLSEQKRYHEKFIAPDAAVLMVDDTPMNLTVFRNLLKSTKVQVDTAGGGAEGLALTRKKKYDILFFDHMMPEKDGIETLHELKAEVNNLNLKTPAICLTANAISGAREKYLAEGFDDYLTKPIDSNKLEGMMMRYLPPEKVIGHSGEDAAPEEPAVELPEWLSGIDEIDIDTGLKHCGGAEGYLETLKIYGENAEANAAGIEGFWSKRDLSNTTIKVHALKSTSRAIGAESLGALAEKLEFAGKAGDSAALDAELDGLLARYRALGVALSPLYASEKEARNEEALPLISDDELREAYDSIREFAASLDADSVAYAVEYLDGFRIPEDERERVEQLRAAVRSFDWDRISALFK